MRYLNILRRFYSVYESKTPKICVVGAGPAGFYAAQHLIKHMKCGQVDMYEKLPVPFGLVRYLFDRILNYYGALCTISDLALPPITLK